MASSVTICSFLEEGNDFQDALACDDFAHTSIARCDVMKALTLLPAKEKRVLTLIYWNDCTQGEAAASMGLSRQWVAHLHGKAISVLRKRLFPYK